MNKRFFGLPVISVFLIMIFTQCEMANLGGVIEWPSYTIVYQANDGSGRTDKSVHQYGTAKNLSSAFPREGYIFLGWAETSGGSVKYTDRQSVNKLTKENGATIPLYAQWETISYTIKYDPNGGIGTMANTALRYDEEQALRANTFTHTETFSGWALEKDGVVEYVDKAQVKNLTASDKGVVTLYAQWGNAKYMVTFIANGGTPAPNPQTAVKGGKLSRPAAMTKDGYRFDGWYTGEQFAETSLWDFDNDTISGPLTLYARWISSDIMAPVTGISDVPNAAVAGTPLKLTGTVTPSYATYQTIEWNVQSAGPTGAYITGGNMLYTLSPGTVTVVASIANGLAAGTSYQKIFTIDVHARIEPVTQITGIPGTINAGEALTLNGTVRPSNATFKTIDWSLTEAGTTGAEIEGNTLNTASEGTVKVTATIENGAAIGTDYTKVFTITVNASYAFIAVTDISGVPVTATAGVPLELTAAVTPGNAAYKTIEWSVSNAGTTGAHITNNTILNTTAAGTVKVTATIENGTAIGTDYTKEFTILVNAGFVPVTGISGIPTTATAKTPLTLSGTVTPSTATYQHIEWRVSDAGTTGAEIEDNILTTTAGGTVKVTATIENGDIDGEDYEQEFTITVNAVSAGIVIQVGFMDEPELVTASAEATANVDTIFTVNGTYTAYQWYVNGSAQAATSSSYTFNRPAGVYEVVVVVTNSAGRKYSGRCRVTVPGDDSNLIAAQGANAINKLQWISNNVASDTHYLVELSANESIAPQTLSYTGKSGVSITLAGGASERTLSLSSQGSMFTVGDGVTLYIDNNITLKGLSSNNNNALVHVAANGALILEDGGKITDNYSKAYAGGVYVAESGSFTMNGGEISGNTSFTSTHNGGAGVCVYGGSFAMYDGKISGNNSPTDDPGGLNGMYTYSDGGGVIVTDSGTFIMEGGEISGNTVSSGGAGVKVELDGNFTMKGGKISGNSADKFGGGVELFVGSFTMEGGEISGNRATYGGGVLLSDTATFTMKDGLISGNTATYGGGVSFRYVKSYFIMEGGEISGNSATYGGGVYMDSYYTSPFLTFTMTDGLITGNTASTSGGGVYVHSHAAFTKTGGTITGYASDTANGNAVKNSSGAAVSGQGHAVRAPSRRQESSAGPTANLSYDSSTGSSAGWEYNN